MFNKKTQPKQTSSFHITMSSKKENSKNSNITKPHDEKALSNLNATKSHNEKDSKDPPTANTTKKPHDEKDSKDPPTANTTKKPRDEKDSKDSPLSNTALSNKEKYLKNLPNLPLFKEKSDLHKNNNLDESNITPPSHPWVELSDHEHDELIKKIGNQLGQQLDDEIKKNKNRKPNFKSDFIKIDNIYQSATIIITNILNKMDLEIFTLISIKILIDRYFKTHPEDFLNCYNIHYLLTACFSLAQKFIEDQPYHNEATGKVTNLYTNQVSVLDFLLFEALGKNIFISQEEAEDTFNSFQLSNKKNPTP